MDKALKVGFLGLSHDHIWTALEQWKRIPHWVCVGVADPHPELVEKFRTQLSAETYFSSYEEFFDRCSVDAVQIMASNLQSAEVGALALKKGIHVLLEKPMASTLEGADKLLKASANSTAKLMINWPNWWRPNLVRAKEIIAGGELGEVFYARMRMGHRGPREMGCSPFFCEWLYEEDENGGGAYMDYCCYGAATFYHFFGKPKNIQGWRGRVLKKQLNVDDNGSLTLYYDNRVCVAEGSWTQDPPGQGAEFYGTRGKIELDRQGLWISTSENERRELEAPPLPVGQSNGVEYFVNCVRSNRPIQGIFSAEAGREAQRILEMGRIPLSPIGRA